jgi:mycothiol synthase
MNDVTVTRRLDDADRANVQALLRRIADDDGFWPLSDQLVADLEHPRDDDADRPISVLAGGAESGPWGYAQASRRDGGWTMQVATHRDGSVTERVRTLADAVVHAVDEIGDGEIDWWVYQPGAEADAVAEASGFAFDRDLLQMRRQLPAERRSAVETRAFVPGQDESAWLAVNNRAFAAHAEQGGWTLDTVRQRTDQPWFDPNGLRLHERDGRLAAFCWTKIHDSRVSLGEIYVIGVDPDFQGLGLGRELTLAGLDHMVASGIEHAMLYVDGGNAAAKTLYDRLGFDVQRTDRAFRRASRVAQ